MGRSRTVSPSLYVTNVTAITGTTVVVLAWDLATTAALPDLIGFAIHRTDHSSGQTLWLKSQTSDELLHTFTWQDYLVSPGTTYTYAVHAHTKSLGLDPSPTTLAVTTETNSDVTEYHRVFFNKGVAGSQAFARKFPPTPNTPLSPAAKAWLSNGLVESFLDFVNGAEEGDTMRGCFYEFTYQPALTAIAAARRRGVDVQVSRGEGGGQSEAREIHTQGSTRPAWDDRRIAFAERREQPVLPARF